MQIGKYSLGRLNDGRWTISWHDRDVGRTSFITVDDLEPTFDDLTKSYRESVSDCCKLFRAAMTEIDHFIDDCNGKAIIVAMPNVETPHGEHYSGIELFRAHLRDFVSGYNVAKGCALRPNDLEVYLVDIKNTYIQKV